MKAIFFLEIGLFKKTNKNKPTSVLCWSQPIKSNASNAWGHSPGLQWASHRHLSKPTLPPDWPLWFLLWQQDARQQHHPKTEKIKVYYLQDPEITQHAWGHTARSQGGVEGRERKRVSAGEYQMFCFYWRWRWGPRVSWALSLLENLKHNRGSLKCREGKRQVTQVVSYQNQPRSLKARNLSAGRWPGSLSNHVAGMC